MNKRKRRYDYGDYYTKPQTGTAPEGAFGQAASPYYTSNNLNSLSAPQQPSKFGQAFNNNQGLFAAAGTAVGEGLSASAEPMVDTAYTQELNKRKQLTKTVGAAASAINPLIGAGVAIGSGIGAQTVDEYGQYKSTAGNAIDEMVNPVTGVQGVLRAFKGKQTGSGVLNKLSLGLFGKSDNQKEAEAGRREFERERLRSIRERSQRTLADYPIYGTAAYGKKFPMGGQLPYPTDDSEVNPLATNIAQYEGSTHDNGGIDLDTNQDSVPEIEVENKEVIKDDMVLSNRLRPSKTAKQAARMLGVSVRKGDTYATLAARIGKKKGSFETNMSSTRVGEKNTAMLMSERLDEAVNLLFMDQQVRKSGKEVPTKFPQGGRYKSYKPGERMPDDPALRAALRKWELSEIPPAPVQQFYPNITLTQGVQQQPYYPLPPTTDPRAQYAFSNKKSKFPGGGPIPYSPEYLKINPLNTQEQIVPKAQINLQNALRFKNSLTGNVVPQVAAESGPANYTGMLSGASILNSYANADPRAIQQADSTINASRAYLGNLKKMNSSMASRAYGGYLPGFPTGGRYSRFKDTAISDKFITDPLNPTSSTRYTYTPTLEDIPVQASNTITAPQPRGFDIGDYKGDIAAGIGTIANQIQIGNLETQYSPETIDAPRNPYTDRTGFLINQANEQYRTASQGIQGSSSQDNLALRANLYAKSLSGLNQSLDQETQRKDVVDARHSELVNRTNIINANIKNQGKFISMENRNKKRALTQANIDNLVRSYMGNETVRDLKDTEFARNYITAAQSGDRGVSERFINSLPKATRRKLGYKKYGGYIDSYRPSTSG